jgi:hypothetical protein
VAHSRRFLSSSFVVPLVGLVGLALSGPACVGFITDDGATGDGDGTESGDGDGDPGDGDGDPAGTTIYDLQQGSVGDGTLVSIQNVVVTTPVSVEDGFAFVQEADAGQWSGISLYLWDEVVMSTQLAPGDIVNITGEYTEYFDMSQLIVKNPGDIEVVGGGQVPGPDIVAAADIARSNPEAEPWEGVRVCVEDVVVQESNDGFGQYVLSGDVLVGHAFVDPLPEVQVGGSFERVCGSLYYTFEEFKLLPAGPEDLSGYGTPNPTAATIPAIQQGEVEIGTLVQIENAIASSGLTWSDDSTASFFVQTSDGGPYSGIEIFVADTAGLDVAPGDQVTVTGTYFEHFDMSQIEVAGASAIMIGGSGPAPAPELVDPAMIAAGGAMSEQYEGVLVMVEDVTVTDQNPDAPMEFGEFAITGNLRVDDEFFAMQDWTKPTVGTAYASITGPLVFGFGNFKLEPREAADLVQN